MSKPNYDHYKTVVTPVVAIKYTHLHEPDTGREYSDDKYKCTAILDPNDPDHAQLIGAIRDIVDLHQSEYPKHNGDNRLSEETDKDGNKTGKLLLTAKTKEQPLIFDASNTPMRPVPEIGWGTKACLEITLAPYTMKSTKSSGTTVYLNQVQVIELKSKDAPAFAPRSGYTYTPPPAEESALDQYQRQLAETDAELPF